MLPSERRRELDQEGTSRGFWIPGSILVLDLSAGYVGICFLVVNLSLYVSTFFCMCELQYGPGLASDCFKQVHAWSTSVRPGGALISLFHYLAHFTEEETKG